MSFFLILLAVVILYKFLCSRKKAKLTPYMLEYFLKITDPVPLCGKPDVVWMNRKGILIVGDYKSRCHHKVYDSDVIQLSVYRLLVEKTQQKPVASFGYIHFKGASMKVKLLSEREIIDLYHRYWKVIEGQVEPNQAGNNSYCQNCSHQSICSS